MYSRLQQKRRLMFKLGMAAGGLKYKEYLVSRTRRRKGPDDAQRNGPCPRSHRVSPGCRGTTVCSGDICRGVPAPESACNPRPSGSG